MYVAIASYVVIICAILSLDIVSNCISDFTHFTYLNIAIYVHEIYHSMQECWIYTCNIYIYKMMPKW